MYIHYTSCLHLCLLGKILNHIHIPSFLLVLLFYVHYKGPMYPFCSFWLIFSSAVQHYLFFLFFLHGHRILHSPLLHKKESRLLPLKIKYQNRVLGVVSEGLSPWIFSFRKMLLGSRPIKKAYVLCRFHTSKKKKLRSFSHTTRPFSWLTPAFKCCSRRKKTSPLSLSLCVTCCPILLKKILL